MVKPLLISSFVDANLMADLTAGRSQTVIIHILNKTPIKWYSKSKSCFKTATYGSEYSNTRIYTDQIVDLCNNLLYLRVPLQMFNGSDTSFMFGENFLVANSNVMPDGKIQRRFQILNYHFTRESEEKFIIKFVHMNGKEIPAGIVTKRCTPNT